MVKRENRIPDSSSKSSQSKKILKKLSFTGSENIFFKIRWFAEQGVTQRLVQPRLTEGYLLPHHRQMAHRVARWRCQMTGISQGSQTVKCCAVSQACLGIACPISQRNMFFQILPTLFSSFVYQETKAQNDLGHGTSQDKTMIRSQGSQTLVQCFFPQHQVAS